MYHILYVDDDPNLLDIGRIFLQQVGPFTVDLQTDAAAALRQIESAQYDAIISDYQMPKMDGIEFLKRVRNSGNTIPFILFTGRGREEIVIQALNEGADYYLQKGGEPVAQFTELSHHLLQAIQKREAHTIIRDHEKRVADIINFLPDAVFAIDTNGTVIAWNRAMEKMTGVGSAQILGKGNYEYAIPFYGDRRPLLINLVKGYDEWVAKRYPRIIRDGDKYSAEIYLPRFNRGNGANFRIDASPLYDSKGDITGAIESVRNITPRILTEKTLRESEEKYRTVFENTGTATLVIHEDCTILLSNNEFARLSGFSRHEIDGKKKWTEFVVSEDLERMLAQHHLRRKNLKNALSGYEFRFIRRSGEIRSISATIDLIPATNTSVASLLDITERIRAEEAASLEKQRMESLFSLGQMAPRDGRELIMKVVDDGIRLTGSRAGYLATINDDESFMTMQYCSTLAPDPCAISAKTSRYSVEKTGLWGEAVRQRKPVIINDYAQENPLKRGIPEGHIPLERHMNIPVFDKDRIVAIAGVGNKETDYDEGDVRQLQLLLQGWRQMEVRRQAEEETRLSNLILKTQMETSPDAILIVDEGRNVISWNQNFLRVWKVPADVIASRRDELVLQHAAQQTRDPDQFMSRIRYLYDHKDEKSSEELVLRDGRILERFSSPMLGEDGKYFGRVWFSRDITERRRAEESVKKAGERYRSLLNNMITGSALHDIVYNASGKPVDYRFVLINPAFEHAIGISGERIIGRTGSEVFGTATPPFLDVFSRVAATGTPETVDAHLESMNRSFSLSVSCPYKGSFVTILQEIPG